MSAPDRGKLPLAFWLWLDDHKHPGLDAFVELVSAARTDRPPSPDVVRELADASVELFGPGTTRERLERFGRRLGMFGQHGKGRRADNTAGTFAEQIGAVGFLVQIERRLQARGESLRAAHAEALRQVAERAGVSERTVRRWESEHRDEAERRLADIVSGKGSLSWL